ncbi:MAG TPA: hypothetical protein PLW50_00375 [Smithellaceae bacterium]|nr:hypothetical protein [Smithellaceae bacterium]
MAVFTHTTDVHRIVGTLDNGLKLIHYKVIPEDGGVTATPITIKETTRIVAWNVFPRDTVTAGAGVGVTYTSVFGGDTSYLSGNNVIYITPSADATSNVLDLLVVGV